jgi:hypothetical protein
MGKRRSGEDYVEILAFVKVEIGRGLQAVTLGDRVGKCVS